MQESPNDNHHIIERYERIWLIFGFLMILLCLVLIAYTVLNQGNTIPQGAGRIDPTTVRTTSQFANPRVEQVGGEFVVYVQAFSFGFLPSEVRVKRGSRVTFYVTSPDVIHGYYVEGTNINLEVIPTEIATVSYTFDRAGTYRILCNQYCGIGHAQMDRIVVEE